MEETYETVQGDTWDIIAKKVYGNEMYAGYLMEANRLLLDYLIFPAGIALSTPEPTEEQTKICQYGRD